MSECTFDGDTGSGDAVYTKESLAEIAKMRKKATFWMNNSGGLRIDIEVDTITQTCVALLADPGKYR